MGAQKLLKSLEAGCFVFIAKSDGKFTVQYSTDMLLSMNKCSENRSYDSFV